MQNTFCNNEKMVINAPDLLIVKNDVIKAVIKGSK